MQRLGSSIVTGRAKGINAARQVGRRGGVSRLLFALLALALFAATTTACQREEKATKNARVQRGAKTHTPLRSVTAQAAEEQQAHRREEQGALPRAHSAA